MLKFKSIARISIESIAPEWSLSYILKNLPTSAHCASAFVHSSLIA